MAVEQAANLAETTLASSYTSGGASIAVTSATGFPTTGTFRVRLGNAGKTIYRVDSVSGTTFTGGAEANDANAAGGDSAILVASRQTFERLIQSPVAGALHAPSGVSGADLYGPLWKLVPFSTTGFSWVNQGGASETVTNGVAHLIGPPNAGQSLRQRVKTQPSTPYTLTVLMEPVMLLTTNSHDVGIHFRESATGKIAAIRMSNSIFKVTTGTAAWSVDQVTTGAMAGVMGRPTWLRLGHDGTNLTWDFSFDGIHFTNVTSRAKTTDFTTAPDQIGYVVNEQGNLNQVEVSVLSWQEA